jgi:hypothetical protein
MDARKITNMVQVATLPWMKALLSAPNSTVHHIRTLRGTVRMYWHRSRTVPVFGEQSISMSVY